MRTLAIIFSFAALILYSCVQAQFRVLPEVYEHKNLCVYLLEGENDIQSQYVTLEEAMKQKEIVLHETSSVNELSVDNKSDKYVFIMAGDIVKGGRQDRTIGEDIVLAPGAKEIPLQSFCVEQSRWAKRGAEDVAAFSESNKVLSDKKIKIAARSTKNQSKVWKEVGDFQEKASKNVNKDIKSSVSASSLQLALEDKDLKVLAQEYMDALKPVLNSPKRNVVGIAFCVNGKISTVEWFGNSALYNSMKAKLLESAVNEAISNYDKELKFTNPDAAGVGDFIDKSHAETFTSNESGDRMLEKQYKTDKSIRIESLDVKANKIKPVHVSIYSTDGVSVEDDHFRQMR